MFWERVFGSELFKKVRRYTNENNFTITSFVRMLVHQFFENREK